MDAQDILDAVMIDDLYFKATCGGIMFGGGEPLLRSGEIIRFCRLKPAEWQVYIETSLNVALSHLESVAPFIDHYYIDIKDMNPDIYRLYTSADNLQVIENLHWLSSNIDVQKITIRLPHIPNYNSEADILESRRKLEVMGFKIFDIFDYIIK